VTTSSESAVGFKSERERRRRDELKSDVSSYLSLSLYQVLPRSAHRKRRRSGTFGDERQRFPNVSQFISFSVSTRVNGASADFFSRRIRTGEMQHSRTSRLSFEPSSTILPGLL